MKASRVVPELKSVVAEASRALTCLDADRLEEIAAWCQTANEERSPQSREELSEDEFARQAREAVEEMTILARVLEATRTNVAVMKRLRELRAGDLEYREALRNSGMGNRDGLN